MRNATYVLTGAPPIDEWARMSSGKTIAILQSSYIPWKGYFDLMAAAD